MANPLKGEVPFEALGRRWVMHLGADEICEAEAILDLGIEEILARMQRGSNFRISRALIHAGLNGGSLATRMAVGDAVKMVTMQQVNEIIEDLGLSRAVNLVADAIRLAFPEPEKEGGGGPPPKGDEAGTGEDC